MCKVCVSIWWVNALFVFIFFLPNDHEPDWINWWGVTAIDKGEKRSRMQGVFLLKVCVCVCMRTKKCNELKYFHQRTVARVCLGSGLFAVPCQNNEAGCFPFLWSSAIPSFYPLNIWWGVVSVGWQLAVVTLCRRGEEEQRWSISCGKHFQFLAHVWREGCGLRVGFFAELFCFLCL